MIRKLLLPLAALLLSSSLADTAARPPRAPVGGAVATNVAFSLDRTLRAAGIPIVGVSIGDPAVRATWVVLFLPEATAAQRTQAANTIATFDPADPAVVAADLDVLAGQKFDTDTMLKAKAVSDLAFRLGVAPGALTAAQINAERSRIIAIYKTLQ